MRSMRHWHIHRIDGREHVGGRGANDEWGRWNWVSAALRTSAFALWPALVGDYFAGSAFQTLISSNQPLWPATPSSIFDLVA